MLARAALGAALLIWGTLAVVCLREYGRRS